MNAVYEFRWASPTGAHTMPHPDELAYFGYRRVGFDPRYGAVLMRRPLNWLAKLEINVDFLPLTEDRKAMLKRIFATIECELDKGEHSTTRYYEVEP